jgi:hypothetical protein
MVSYDVPVISVGAAFYLKTDGIHTKTWSKEGMVIQWALWGELRKHTDCLLYLK